MPERGGPTTQSGIQYQNSVAALYLGQLIESAPRQDAERVTEVRVEAPEHVDDTVVTYADGHKVYIQSKEDIQVNEAAWTTLWEHFLRQCSDDQFVRGRDQLLLILGTPHERHHQLREACERASTSHDYAEWQSRLTQQQKELIAGIRRLLSTEMADEENLLAFFKHVRVEIQPWWLIDPDLIRSRVPPSNMTQKTLFRLLRDRIGGESRVRGTFTAARLIEQLAQEDGVFLTAAPSLDDLRSAVSTTRNLLRQHRHTFGGTGLHLDRTEVDGIVTWAQGDEEGKDPVALLLDRAGMGKSVVLRDVIQRLEEAGVAVLAIKADLQLSGVESHDDLQQRLQLPEPVERAVIRLAREGPVVVVIDQLDALSLSMARDEQALTVALELIAHLRRIPNVRLVVSCRTFDWSSDPRLSNVQMGARFPLAEFTDEEIRRVLASIAVDIAALTPATRTLLRVPLHLDLFVRAIESRPAGQRVPSAIESLQDLYALLWQSVVLKPDPAGPPLSERVAVLRLMTERMHREQQTAVPQALFTRPETADLQPALVWLASAGIVMRGVGEWTYLHQTFFDYCYAREFVEGGGQLATTILAGDQGFAARPHLVQVLGYLRGANPTAFIRELSTLLRSDNLRYHLRDLALNFLGAVVSPTEQEWLLVRRLLADVRSHPKMLRAMSGQPDWWPLVHRELLPGMLESDDAVIDAEVLPYLASLVGVSQGEVASVLRAYAGRSDYWNNRIAWVLSHVRHWEAPEALGLFESLFSYEVDSRRLLYQVHDVATASPEQGCRLIRAILDRLLDGYIAKLNRPEEATNAVQRAFARPTLYNELEALNGSTFVETVNSVAEAEPRLFLELMLPWLVRVLALTPVRDDTFYFTDDELSGGWHDNVFVVKLTLIGALRTALIRLGEQDAEAFRRVVNALADLPYETPQQLLAQAYASMPERFAMLGAEFLLTDQRRLHLGDREQFESRRLISAIYPVLSEDKRLALEEHVLSYRPIHKGWGIYGLRRSGIEQLYLLQAVPEHLLSPRSVQRLRELERKFPGVKASEDPAMMHSGWVTSPIEVQTALRMSDRDWLRAIRHYQGAARHKEHFKGGADELSGVLASLIRGNAQQMIPGNPERFFRLLAQVPDTVDDAYVRGFLNGFAESAAPADRLFFVARRFWSQPGRDIRRTAAWCLEKRIHDGLPDDLLNLLEEQVRSPIGEDEELREDGQRDPYDRYLNSDRGAAFHTLVRALEERGTPEAKQHKWELLEFAASDESTPLRAGALEQLLYLLSTDGDRAVALFERLMEGHPGLSQSHFASEFVYYVLYRYFGRMRPFITAMMESDREAVQQRGAELACIAHISLIAPELEDVQAEARALAERAVRGVVSWRRGAARIYAYNLGGQRSEACELALLSLIDEDDETVRRNLSGAIRMLRGEHFLPLRGFLERFAASRSAQTGAREFTEYLLAHGLLDPAWTLSIIETLLAQMDPNSEEIRFGGGENLIRLVARIYNDPISDDETRRRAMDRFDALMEKFAGAARLVLDEWDRR